jgi:hypothetical protein
LDDAYSVATGNYELYYEAPVQDREQAYMNISYKYVSGTRQHTLGMSLTGMRGQIRNKYKEKEWISEVHSTKPTGALALTPL